MKIRMGIMGAGGIAAKMADAVKLVPDLEVTAVSSKDMERAKAFAKKHGIAEAYGSYKEMLEQGKIDLVYIATTHNFHYDNCKLALSYQKHVLCEKCFVLHYDQAKELTDLARNQGLFLMEAMWSRFLPAPRQAKKWIEEGRIGKPVTGSFHVGFCGEYNPSSRIFNPELAGGALYDVGVYAIEMATYYLGKIEQANCITTYTPTGVDGTDCIYLRFQSGAMAGLQASVVSHLNNHAYISGETGYIELPDSCNTAKFVTLFDGEKKITLELPYDNGFEYQLMEVCRCIGEGKVESEVMPHKDTLECAQLFDQFLKKK